MDRLETPDRDEALNRLQRGVQELVRMMHFSGISAEKVEGGVRIPDILPTSELVPTLNLPHEFNARDTMYLDGSEAVQVGRVVVVACLTPVTAIVRRHFRVGFVGYLTRDEVSGQQPTADEKLFTAKSASLATVMTFLIRTYLTCQADVT